MIASEALGIQENEDFFHIVRMNRGRLTEGKGSVQLTSLY